MNPDLFTHPPVLGIAAWSGTGKTTLLVQVLPLLQARGIRIGMIKHAHHAFDIDVPGKDSYELRKAGAGQMLVASEQRWALMHDHPQPQEPKLEQLISLLQRDALDLILVEGFRHLAFPKIELHRPSMGRPLLSREDASVIALASDAPVETPLPLLDLNSPQQVAAFIIDFMQSRA